MRREIPNLRKRGKTEETKVPGQRLGSRQDGKVPLATGEKKEQKGLDMHPSQGPISLVLAGVGVGAGADGAAGAAVAAVVVVVFQLESVMK